MKTIEERAEFNYPYISEDWLYSVQEVTAKEIIDMQRESYKDGATEQEKITIDKAWNWIEDNLFEKDTRNLDLWQRDFRKAMEE